MIKDEKEGIKYIKSNKKGITLVALVVTIIVLLILAGVTITILMGDNGIIRKAQEAADSTNAAVEDELKGMNDLLEKLNGTINDAESLTGTIEVGTTKWSEGEATITLSTSTSFTIQYKIGNSETWIPASYSTSTAGTDVTVTGLSHNSIVYARLINNEGNIGSETKVTIVDDINPSEAIIDVTGGTGVLNATVELIDEQSGVDIANSKYICNTTSEKLEITNTIWDTADSFSSNPETLHLRIGEGGEYYLHILIVDNAGNRTECISPGVTITPPSVTPDA